MGRFRWQIIAACQALLGFVGLGLAIASDGDGALAAWYAFGPGWLLLAVYSWRNKPGRPADAPTLDNVVLLGGGVVALIAGVFLGI